MERRPLLSIITVCYNSASSIRKTLDSVLSQTFTDFEYIIKDGQSTDETNEIIQEYLPRFAERGLSVLYVSSADHGIYDAMNEAIRMSAGKWLNFLNADDRYIDSGILERLFAQESQWTEAVVCGNAIEEEFGKRYLFAAAPEVIEKRHAFCHQAAMIRADWMKKYEYDSSLKIAGDYDFFLHIYHDGAIFRKVDMPLVMFAKGGVSTDRIRWIKEETLLVRSRYGYATLGGWKNSFRLKLASVKQWLLLHVSPKMSFYLRNLTRPTTPVECPKLLVINTCWQGGGAEKVTRQICAGAYERGYEVHVILGRGEMPDYPGLVIYDNIVLKGINWFYKKITNNARTYDPITTYKVLKYIKKHDISVVHLHNAHGNYFGLDTIRKISEKCRLIWTLHDMWAYTGHCACALLENDALCNQWESKDCSDCPAKGNQPPIYQNCSGQILRDKATYYTGQGIQFITPSQWMRDCAKKSILENEDVQVINNGIELDVFQYLNKESVRERYQIPSDKHVLAFVCNRLSNREKGFPYLLQMLNCLPNKQDYYLLLVGNDADCGEISTEFQKKSFGYVRDPKKLNEIYAMADIFVTTSLIDNFPMVVMEALASGTPVMAFEICGIPEMLTLETGWLVPRGDSEKMAYAVMSAFECPEKLKKMGEACRERAEEKYDLSQMIDQYCALYKE